MVTFGLAIIPAALAANGADNDKAVTDSATSASKDVSKDASKDAKSDAKTAPAAAPSNAEIAAEVDQLRALLKSQSEQIAELREALAHRNGPSPMESSSSATGPSAFNGPASPILSNPKAAADEKKESPLSFRIGGTDFTPGGFVDFENVFRTTNTGNVASTSFGAIPFSNTVAGHLTEYRATGQYSRVNLKVHGKYGETDITGYVEADFNGNDAASVFDVSNPHTNRLRLYWVDLKRGKWEFLGGQTWGLETPNRVGVSPNPSDVFGMIGEDANIHVGVNYTRAAAFRTAYHFSDSFVGAIEFQNPQQFSNGQVTFPTAFNAQLSGQIDAGNLPGTPNLMPDIISKFAYDKLSGRHIHLEAGGLLSVSKITVLPTGPGHEFTSHTSTGGAVLGGFAVDLWRGDGGRNFAFLGNGMWGIGIGRYLNILGPNFMVRPTDFPGETCITPVGGPSTGCDATISGIHGGDIVLGFESQITRKTMFGAYYGGYYSQRNFATDFTSPAATQPLIGYGFVNSANNQNRAIQEGSFDWTQTLISNPQYGKVMLVTQASYLTRAPWFVANGAPKNAHLFMEYVSLRYVLP